MTSKNVYVVGRDTSVESLFEERGWEVFAGRLPGENVLKMLDLVVFTGGSDINPAVYGEENLGSFISEGSKNRDAFEIETYQIMNELKVPKAGICRGGQLFNIMNGGSMIQHIDGHEYGTHRIHGFLEGGGSHVMGYVNSCHHQQMIPKDRENVMAISDDDVPEVIFYPEHKDLCFQAHPEWGHENTTKLFFTYIETCLGVKL